MRRLWLRWSWRDLRIRWVQVAAIAMIVALGSGTYSGLSSTSAWRRVSYDASFARLHMYDLRAQLASGSYVDANALAQAAAAIPHAGSIDRTDVRLVGPTQVDASTPGKTILVPGRIVGVEVADGGPHVNGVEATAGRGLRPDDAGRDVGVLDLHFAKHYDLASRGKLRISGGRSLEYVGQGLSPEYFVVTGEQGNLLAEANFAVVFVPLATAQSVLGHPGQANDLVLTLHAGTDLAVVQHELTAALKAPFPNVGVTMLHRRDDRTYQMLYDDIEGDQKMYNIFALLILFGAAFAAFNLTGRIVQSQRREIGIGMALGEQPARLAIRPLLVGAQVAALGAVFGVGVGLVVARAMAGLMHSLFPLPVWHFAFQPGIFLQGAALGLVVPIVATLFPVWRAVRVTPVRAIRTGYLADSGRGGSPWLTRVPVPGRSTTQIPFRNVLRAPRRTVMTMLGIAAAITVLIGEVGMLDSFYETIDRAAAELGHTAPDRLTVSLDFFYPEDGALVTDIERSPLVTRAHPALQLGGSVRNGNRKVDIVLDLTDLHSHLWRPTVKDRVRAGGPGIVLTEKAARDLGVRSGDAVTLRHPRREGATSYRFVNTRVPVIGVSPLPTRFVAFMDRSSGAKLMNLSGIVNTVVVNPRPGVSTARIQRALFGQPGVASVQPVSALTETIRKALDRAVGILTIVEAAVLLLALLIAFNSASINMDERAREHATMFAFGLPTRTVMRMGVVESIIIGLLGTATGLLLGWLLLGWLVQTLLPQTLPDLGIVTAVAPRTLLTAVILGVLAVAVAPLLTLRKLRHMDVASTLRVME